MKPFLLGTATAFIAVLFMVFQFDYNNHNRYIDHLDYVAEEAAAAAAQYISSSDYAEGKIVFNQIEGMKALEYVIKTNLKLDDLFQPKANSYWNDPITYTVEFYDDGNTTFPYLYKHPNEYYHEIYTGPTVVVTINAGRPSYHTIQPPGDSVRVASHTWEERKEG